MQKSLINNMLNESAELLSQGRTITEWFDPANKDHMAAYEVFLETKSWPAGAVPEGVALTPGWEGQLAQKIFTSEGKVPSDKDDSEEKIIQKLTEAGPTDDGQPGIPNKDFQPGADVGEEPAPDELEPDDKHEAVEADFDKVYLGQNDTTHFYVVAKKGDSGETEDLQITDQEGKELFSAKENELDPHDVAKFILAALDSNKVKIAELERDVVMKYLVPQKEEEIEAEEEEGEEPGGEEMPLGAENEPKEEVPLSAEKNMKGVKPRESKQLSETMSVKDDKGNTFSIQVIDEGSKDIVVQINNREFRFKPEFAALYEMAGGKLTEQGLQDLAQEVLGHLDDSEYAEVIGSGIQEDLDPSVTQEVGEDSLLQRAQQLRAKKDRSPDDETTLQQLEDELKTRGQKEQATEGKVPSDKDDSEEKIIQKLTEQNLNEPAGFQSCVDRGGRVRTVSGVDKEHGLAEGEYVKYCYIDDKSFRGEVHKKESESKIAEAEKDGLAKNAGKKPGDFDKVQLAVGTKVEKEHTDDHSKAQQIAMDHLTEDPKYYMKLKKMEAGGCGEAKMNKKNQVKENEYSDMTALTKDVFQVDFVLQSGEKKSTRVMAFDENDAKVMMKRNKDVKSVIGTPRKITGPNESKRPVKEDTGSTRREYEIIELSELFSAYIQRNQEVPVDQVKQLLDSLVRRVGRNRGVELVRGMLNDEGWTMSDAGILAQILGVDIKSISQGVHDEEEGFGPEGEEPTERRSVQIAKDLLGLKEAKVEDEPVKVGDFVQIVDANSFRVEVEEATVKALDEKQGVEITGSNVPDSQKWYRKPFWTVYKL